MHAEDCDVLEADTDLVQQWCTENCLELKNE
jgi:hypothetical protein